VPQGSGAPWGVGLVGHHPLCWLEQVHHPWLWATHHAPTQGLGGFWSAEIL